MRRWNLALGLSLLFSCWPQAAVHAAIKIIRPIKVTNTGTQGGKVIGAFASLSPVQPLATQYSVSHAPPSKIPSAPRLFRRQSPLTPKQTIGVQTENKTHTASDQRSSIQHNAQRNLQNTTPQRGFSGFLRSLGPRFLNTGKALKRTFWSL